MNKNNNAFIKTVLKSQIEISAIYTIHYFRYGKNFKFKKEQHPFWELIYIDSGSAKIFAGDKTFTLKQGQAFLHKPDEIHTVYTDDAFANSAIISFDSKSRPLYLLADKILRLGTDEKGLLNKIISEAKTSYSDKLNELNLVKMTKKSLTPFGSDQIIKNCAELIMISLLRTQENHPMLDEATLGQDYSPFVSGVIGIMNEKLDSSEQVTLEEIAQKTGYSKSFVKTKFKQETGKSVLQYYIFLKMQKAKILIAHGNLSITEISDKLGFSSVHYFCRQFKLNTDMTPTEYLHSIKTENLL